MQIFTTSRIHELFQNAKRPPGDGNVNFMEIMTLFPGASKERSLSSTPKHRVSHQVRGRMRNSLDGPLVSETGQTESIPLALMEATRELLWIGSTAEARIVAIHLVNALGGRFLGEDDVKGQPLPFDLSFGDGPPLLATAPADSHARTLLEKYLPSFVIDVRRILLMQSRIESNEEHASQNNLNQLGNHRRTRRVLARLCTNEIVVMIDFDHFKRFNDALGHDTGDQLLSSFAQTLSTVVRVRDFAGRYGGEKFIVILPAGSEPEPFLRRLHDSWTIDRPHEITFSAGICRVDKDLQGAPRAAFDAMCRAKSEGRDRWVWSNGSPDEPTPEGESSGPSDDELAVITAIGRSPTR